MARTLYETTELHRLCLRVTSGGTPSRSVPEYFEGGTIPWMKTGEVKQRFVYTTEEHITELGLESSSAKLIPANSLVVAMYGDGDTAGNVAINKVPVTTNQACCNFVVDPTKADYRFLYYFLKANYGNLVNLKLGGSQQNLNAATLKRFPVPVVPLALQRKIAAILSAYDDLIANNQRRIALLEGMAEEIYREWFVRRRVPAGMDEGGAGWVEKRFASVCEFRKGRTPDAISMDAAEGLSPYLSVDVLDGNDVAAWVNARKIDVLAGADDVVMLMDGARSGVVFRGAAGVVGSTAALIATAPINRPMVFEYLKAMREVIVWNNTGSAIPHANKDFINRMVLRVPAREQVLISFNQIYEPLFEQVQRLRQTNVLLRRTRDALLPRLISGKLKVDHLDIRLPPSMRAEAEAVA